jgi:hypothetical protein
MGLKSRSAHKYGKVNKEFGEELIKPTNVPAVRISNPTYLVLLILYLGTALQVYIPTVEFNLVHTLAACWART